MSEEESLEKISEEISSLKDGVADIRNVIERLCSEVKEINVSLKKLAGIDDSLTLKKLPKIPEIDGLE